MVCMSNMACSRMWHAQTCLHCLRNMPARSEGVVSIAHATACVDMRPSHAQASVLRACCLTL